MYKLTVEKKIQQLYKYISERQQWTDWTEAVGHELVRRPSVRTLRLELFCLGLQHLPQVPAFGSRLVWLIYASLHGLNRLGGFL